MTKQILFWVLRITAAGLLLQTLYFKFTGAEESVYIFSELGMEPWGRIGTGVMELIAAIFILIPGTTAMGSVTAVGLMSGALFFHLTKLGIEVQNDGGLLFTYAIIVLIASLILLFFHLNQLTRFLRIKF